MSLSLGSVVNTAANVSSRKSDSGKPSESTLYEFMHAISSRGVQIKSNFEVEFPQIAGFQFYCTSVSIPGMKSNVGSLYFRGREVQIPINMEQDHEFQFSVMNDGQGVVYTQLRNLMADDLKAKKRMLNNGYYVIVKARGDAQNFAGMNIVLRGVRLTNISGLDFSHTDSTVQTFTVDGYANYVDFMIGSVKKKEGALDKVDKLSNKVSGILGK